MRKGRKISGYLFKRGGVWWVRWQSGGQVFRRSTEETAKPKARDKAAEYLAPFKALEERDTLAAVVSRMNHAETSAQAAVDLANRIPLAEVWRRFPYDHSQPRRKGGAIRELSPMNIQQNKGDWQRFMDWMEENHKKAVAMQDVTPAIAQAYSDYLYKRQRVTAGRHNKLITTAGVMYRLAGVPSPFEGVTKYQLPKEAEHREPFTVEQVQKLLGAATGEMRGLVALLYFTGLRAGDAVQLRHENRKDGKIVLQTAKTGACIDILEHPLLTKMLAEVCGDARKGLLFPELAEAYRKDHTALIRRFNRLMTLAFGTDFESTEKRTGRGVLAIARYGAHSFRHALITHCAKAGVPIGYVQQWVGHASAAITRVYQHFSTADQQRILQAIPRLALPGMEGDIIESKPAEVVEQTLDRAALVAVVKTLTPKTAAKVRAQLLEMLGA